ncbi:MAG: CSLREA domain-containing protein [Actinomycetota bacterium]|nr:CSLREA domain-containing protein [Actinomycetota bacterium]
MIRTNNRLGVSAAAVGVLAVSLLMLLLWPALPSQAQSATRGPFITVNTTKDETTPNDGECSLREAIQNANGDAQTSPDCKPGKGEDTITFKKGLSGTITLDPALGPLPVTAASGLTIDGGQGSITVSGDGKIQVFESKDAKLALENLTVADGFVVQEPSPNPKPDKGGGIVNDGGTLTVTSSTFSGNNANVGGGIANIDGGALMVTNSTFSGNGAVAGGGIANDGTLTVTNSTFSSNGADLGGGIQNAFVATATATLSNTILANSKGTNPLNCRGKITDGGYNISDDSSCAFTDPTSKNDTNPLLDPNGLQYNGGPTPTIALQKGSPALDYIPKGQNGCNTTIKTDQRGVKRPQGKACDVGAYELQK